MKHLESKFPVFIDPSSTKISFRTCAMAKKWWLHRRFSYEKSDDSPVAAQFIKVAVYTPVAELTYLSCLQLLRLFFLGQTRICMYLHMQAPDLFGESKNTNSNNRTSHFNFRLCRFMPRKKHIQLTQTKFSCRSCCGCSPPKITFVFQQNERFLFMVLIPIGSMVLVYMLTFGVYWW